MATHDVDETVLTLIGSGQADTRPAIVKQTGLAASTVSAAVSRLVEAGVISETDESVSTGGRRARRLVTSDGVGALALVELGAHHGLVALTDPTQGVMRATSFLVDIASGPEAVLTAVMEEVSRQEKAAGVRVGGLALAVPGPVDAEHTRVIRPARMPGWDGINVAEEVARHCGLPAIIDNDARAGAVGESVYRRRLVGVAPIDTLIYVKAGSAIGGAYLVDGVPLVGQGGLAGDISHIPVDAASGRPCKCGNVGCLETIASADSIRADLAAAGLVYENNAQLLAAARDGVPAVATAIRQAGTLLGLSLAHLVSFLAPQGVILGGALSAVDAFSAGVRAALHQSCLPSIMEDLVIESSRSGRDAALWGLSTLTPQKISKENHS
ncbi:ROK family protein [uncultured Actinomyces sp.]|uniref:ROK family transcriptional regulator n=1 Tax=uncultured Actinomyces sp. TaxID=249061 RepID=UPI0028F0EE9E|nr:ROK family protein [uncultured Actinomyces sp.]